jgi:predicted NAD/FAD-binding protein
MHGQLVRTQRTSFCGAYWGNGFHEDGVNSALAVCRRFGIDGFAGTPTRPVLTSAEYRQLVSSSGSGSGSGSGSESEGEHA